MKNKLIPKHQHAFAPLTLQNDATQVNRVVPIARRLTAEEIAAHEQLQHPGQIKVNGAWVTPKKEEIKEDKRTDKQRKEDNKQGKAIYNDKKRKEQEDKINAGIWTGIGLGGLALAQATPAAPWLDAAFAAHGGYGLAKQADEGTLGLNTETGLHALEMMPLGIKGGAKAIKFADNAARQAYAPYDFYRTIQESPLNLSNRLYREIQPKTIDLGNGIIGSDGGIKLPIVQNRIKFGDVEINNPQLAYRQGPSVADDFLRKRIVEEPEIDAQALINEFKAEYETLPESEKVTSGFFGYSNADEYAQQKAEDILARSYNSAMFSQGKPWFNLNQKQMLVTAEPLGVANQHGTLLKRNPANGTFDVRAYTRGDGTLKMFDGRRVQMQEGQLTPKNTHAFILDPNYGYKKVTSKPSTIYFNTARTAQQNILGKAPKKYYNGDIEGERFGKLISDEGSEKMIYQDVSNPDRVLKVYDSRMDDMSSQFKASDLVDEVHEGWVTTPDGKYYRVTSQPKYNDVIEGLNKEQSFQAAKYLEDNGWTPYVNKDGILVAAEKDGKVMNDITDGNWAYDTNGDLRLIDNNIIDAAEGWNKNLTPIRTAQEQPLSLDDAYMKTIQEGDMKTAQKLRDQHFIDMAPNTVLVDKNRNPIHKYHGSKRNFTVFKTKRPEDGIFFTSSVPFAKDYTGFLHNGKLYDTYLNIENPITMSGYGKTWQQLQLENLSQALGIPKEQVLKEIPYKFDDINPFQQIYNLINKNHPEKQIHNYQFSINPTTQYISKKGINDGFIVSDVVDAGAGLRKYNTDQTIVFKPSQIKSADPVTYFKADDPEVLSGQFKAGDIIPLSMRDNFKKNDIRFGLAPWLVPSTIGSYSLLKTK